MRIIVFFLILCLAFFANGRAAQAEFILGSSIIEFNKDSGANLDIDLVSRSKDSDYIATEVSEIIHPGLADEHRQIIEDPTQGGLLVTPDKMVLAGGNRKTLRFVLLRDLDEQEHIYRVKVQPVIKGVDNKDSRVGLKILVGYEVLAIVRPIDIKPDYSVERNGRALTFVNKGNSNILFQNGKQCSAPENCKDAPVVRVYPGERRQITLVADAPVTYSIWDGMESTEKQY